MEVLIRWRCGICRQSPKGHCGYCHNNGFMERWIPYFLLRDIQAVMKEALIISGRRIIPASGAPLDSLSPAGYLPRCTDGVTWNSATNDMVEVSHHL